MNPRQTSTLRNEPPAESLRAPAAGSRIGRVTACATDNWLVREAGRSHRLRRAVSCMLVPVAGDTVAWIEGPQGTNGWIVAVLERDPLSAGSPAELRFDGDLRLQVKGHWSVGVKRMSVDADSADLAVREVKFRFDTFQSIGQLVQATVQQTRWVGQELCCVIDRWFQHSKSHQRHTEGLEIARARVMELKAEQLVRVEAPNVLTEGSDLVKTRGSQIHFG